MKNYQGFSIIELLIVVVVIGIIAAIGLPNLLAARRSANEGSAISSVRALHQANVSYAASTGTGNYAGEADTLGTSSLTELADAGLIDVVLGSGGKSGYSFVGNRTEAAGTEPQTFFFAANPTITSGVLMTGTKRFGILNDGVIRSDATPANLAVVFDAVTLLSATPLNE